MKTELKSQATLTLVPQKAPAASPTNDNHRAPAVAEKDPLRRFDALVLRARIGDQAALASVMVYLRPVLIGHAKKALGPYKQDAEDVVQEVLLSLIAGPRVPIAAETPGQWLVNRVQEAARGVRQKRDRDWGNDGDGPG